ncbi:MAG TPA: hypothetical protein VL426_06380 [Candidatus Binatia bacterium]|nr:hypothetical protein [Candidatus Binatia bacterium]
MRTFIGWSLLFCIIPYGIYASFHPGYAPGIVALAVAGGIMIRRARNERDHRLRALYAELDTPPKVTVDTAIPGPPRVPTFPPQEFAAAPEAPSEPPPQAQDRTGERRDEIRPPPPEREEPRTVLKLVWSDGKRADVRDFRRRAAK